METPIQFRIDQKDGVGIFHIDDRRLDSKISTLYKQEFVRLKEQGLTQLVVDLSDVEFIDSSGLGALLMGRRLMEEAGGDLLHFISGKPGLEANPAVLCPFIVRLSQPGGAQNNQFTPSW